MTEFLSDIINIYPENSEIVQAKSMFETVKKANPSLLIKTWFKHVYLPYKDVIDSGNIAFFFEKDYSSDLINLNNSQKIIEIIKDNF
jgi:hypothetical protein